MTIGLAGGYCAGKNAVESLLRERGFTCFDLDRIGHEALALEETMEAIAWRFGPGALGPEGLVDRKALGALVFGDPEGLADLEAIVHPAVYRLFKPRLEAEVAAGRDVCLNAALLHRMEEAKGCDFIIEVRAPLAIRVIRGCARDGLRIRDVLARIWSQRSFRKELRLLGRPLRPLWNDGDRRTLEDRLERLLMAGSSTRAAVPASDAASAKPST